ncbi:MAG TPA: response regulator [Candidatus Koribacter sp.]
MKLDSGEILGLNIVVLEDDPVASDLLVVRLKQEGLAFSPQIAHNRSDFQKFFPNDSIDLVLADSHLEDWTGVDAVRWLRQSGNNVPFILVAGTLGEEQAIECVKAGVNDYVLKHNLSRLPHAIRRAMTEARLLEERDAAALEIRRSEEQYRLLFESNPHPMWVSDPVGSEFLAVNRAAIDRYGYSEQEFLQMKMEDLRPVEERGVLDLDKNELRRKGLGVYGELWRHRRNDGSIIDVEITSQLIPFRGREARLFLVHDVTNSLKIEQRLRQAQRMEAIGRLAGGVAHDFNNLLMVISSYAQLAETELDDPKRVARSLSQVITAVDRAAHLTKQLLAFSRKQPQELRALDVDAVISEFSQMFPALLGADIDLHIKPNARDAHIYADGSQIEQVIMNLVVNARDAMPEGGRLTIESSRIYLDNAYFQELNLDQHPGDYVMLAVSDTGIGMDAATKARVFEPFFTTKGPGKGTGLGLSTVYGIAKQNNGYVWVYSEPGRGTTFKVYFPLSRAEGEIVAETLSPESDLTGDETILLVEDEAALRDVATKFLEAKGYQVLSANNAAEALLFCAKEQQNIDLLVTDLVMPGIGGKELASRIFQRCPSTHIVFISGYTENHQLVDELEFPAQFLQKPFSLSTLAKTIRRALAS